MPKCPLMERAFSSWTTRNFGLYRDQAGWGLVTRERRNCWTLQGWRLIGVVSLGLPMAGGSHLTAKKSKKDASKSTLSLPMGESPGRCMRITVMCVWSITGWACLPTERLWLLLRLMRTSFTSILSPSREACRRDWLRPAPENPSSLPTERWLRMLKIKPWAGQEAGYGWFLPTVGLPNSLLRLEMHRVLSGPPTGQCSLLSIIPRLNRFTSSS